MLKDYNVIRKLASGSRWGRFIRSPYKYVYAKSFEKIIYPFNKKGNAVKCNTFFDSIIQVVLPAGMDIYLLGSKSHDSELRLTQYLLNSIQPGQTFIDVGAHFGFYSQLASKLVGPEGKVLSIEPSPENHEILKKNILAHPNILAVQKAITDNKLQVDFYEFPILLSEYNTMYPDQFDNEKWIEKNKAKSIKVEGQKLDCLVKEYGLNPNLIKIDVEGGEFGVINGMEETLKYSDDLRISMEFLGGDSHLNAVEKLWALGYQPYVILTDGSLEFISRFEIDDYLVEKGLRSDNIIFLKG